ncbi:MAG: ABC transporter permease subunit [Lachnospiraceae bacterium]
MIKEKKNKVTYVIVVIFIMVVIIPIITMCIWAFTERWSWPDLLPQVSSLRAFHEIMGRKRELCQIFACSICISVVVALLSVVIGIMTARALVLYEFKGKGIFYFLSLLPFLVPATVFAMGIQVTFIRLGLSNSVIGVMIVHLVCSLPYAVRLLMDGTSAVGNKLEEQARVLGAGPWKAFYKVTLPVLTPVILSAMSMSYIVSFSQYFLTLLIGGGSVKTFTIVMVPYLQGGNRNIACIYSIAFLGITLIVFGVFEWIIGKWIKNNSMEYYA